jgi:endoglucanase
MNARDERPVVMMPMITRLVTRRSPHWAAFVSAVLIAILTGTSAVNAEEVGAVQDNELLGRGISFGNALDAPQEGAWGVTLKEQYFQAIQAAGFKSVRLPIRWSAHGAPAPPFTIAPDFFARVDWAVQQTLSRQMSIVLDMHHFVDLYADPEKQLPRLLALWDQIASHYRDYPRQLFFELVNEPFNQLTDDRWQSMIPELVQTIRKTNPDRELIIGPGFWNSLDHLDRLHLPNDDRHLIATFHYYVPMRFTHQGAAWVSGADQWKNVTWTGTADETKTLKEGFDKAASWGRANHRRLYVGEFGTIQNADMDSRARWASAVVQEAEKRQMSWAFWDFFAVYDAQTNKWREQLLHALIPR